MALEATTDDEREQNPHRALYEEIATLAGGLAHEIRNPLSTISMNLELVIEELQESDEPRDLRLLRKMQSIQRECRRLEDILQAFLQFLKAGELEPKHCDLNRLVEEFIEFYRPKAAERHIEISPHLAADLPPVNVDEALLRQALLNLALNAQEAMPHGGLLELQTYLRDGRVHLAMIDNGRGMDEATRRRMFEAFYSTRPGGSGLGLPTVRKIIEAHHGTITCESEPGRGTRFTIALPPADVDASVASAG